MFYCTVINPFIASYSVYAQNTMMWSIKTATILMKYRNPYV